MRSEKCFLVELNIGSDPTTKLANHLHSIAGLGFTKLGCCIQYTGADPLTWINEEQFGNLKLEEQFITICYV